MTTLLDAITRQPTQSTPTYQPDRFDRVTQVVSIAALVLFALLAAGLVSGVIPPTPWSPMGTQERINDEYQRGPVEPGPVKPAPEPERGGINA